MLTRREEDIVIEENDEKNNELLLEWVEGKDGARNSRPVPGTTEATEGSVPVATSQNT